MPLETDRPQEMDYQSRGVAFRLWVAELQGHWRCVECGKVEQTAPAPDAAAAIEAAKLSASEHVHACRTCCG